MNKKRGRKSQNINDVTLTRGRGSDGTTAWGGYGGGLERIRDQHKNVEKR